MTVAVAGMLAGLHGDPRRHATGTEQRGFRVRPGRQRLAGVAGPRHQRRPEDDGRHDPRADRQRALDRARPRIPVWVKVSAAAAIALGTYLGGWRIIRTLGKGLVDISPAQGMVEREQLGRGHAVLEPPRLRAVDHPRGHRLDPRLAASAAAPRCGGTIAGRMVAAWAITFPSAGLVGALMWWIGDSIGGALGAIVVFLILAAFSRWIGSAARAASTIGARQRQRRRGTALPRSPRRPTSTPRSPTPRTVRPPVRPVDRSAAAASTHHRARRDRTRSPPRPRPTEEDADEQRHSSPSRAPCAVLVVGLVFGAGLPVVYALGIRAVAYGQGGDAELSQRASTAPRSAPSLALRRCSRRRRRRRPARADGHRRDRLRHGGQLRHHLPTIVEK